MNELLPSSPASERNRGPILVRLRTLFADTKSVLEIGSGTGQHAEFFAREMPALHWQCSDRELEHGLDERIRLAALRNLPLPIPLDATTHWPSLRVDAVYTANTLHIMHAAAVEMFFVSAGKILPEDGRCVVYGPFHFAGKATSEGNALFDRELRSRGNGEGIRDIAWIMQQAQAAGLRLLADCAMPANNRLLAWEKTP